MLCSLGYRIVLETPRGTEEKIGDTNVSIVTSVLYPTLERKTMCEPTLGLLRDN